jgi:hypothetical protein
MKRNEAGTGFKATTAGAIVERRRALARIEKHFEERRG